MDIKRMLAIELDIHRIEMNKEAVKDFLYSVADVISDSIISNKDCGDWQRTFHTVDNVAVTVTLDGKPMPTYTLFVRDLKYTVKATSIKEAVALFKKEELIFDYYICEEGGLPFFTDEFNLANYIDEEKLYPDIEDLASVDADSVSTREYQIYIDGYEDKFNLKANSYQGALADFKDEELILEFTISSENDVTAGSFDLNDEL